MLPLTRAKVQYRKRVERFLIVSSGPSSAEGQAQKPSNRSFPRPCLDQVGSLFRKQRGSSDWVPTFTFCGKQHKASGTSKEMLTHRPCL